MNDLFSNFHVGDVHLSNRIVMAPMTRARAPGDVANELIALYYAQRATSGLIISEGTPISREGQGYLFNPGIFNSEQIEGWKLTTQSVHALGGRIFAQLWHVGRVSHPSIQEGGKPPVSASSKIAKGATAFGYDEDGKVGLVPTTTPRVLSASEVTDVVQDFSQAAANAIEAGFDGVEIHGANGYLHEQFLNPMVNDRTDQYSSDTMENRLRFTLEVVDAVIARIGNRRVGIRFSPFSKLFDMPHYENIKETYTALAEALGQRRIAFIHIMDHAGYKSPNGGGQEGDGDKVGELLRVIRPMLPQTALMLAGAMTRKRADALIGDGTIDLAVFGQPFISNPDLVARLRNGWPLATPDRTTYYGGAGKGFVDYPPYQETCF